jgi:hypothetical protein
MVAGRPAGPGLPAALTEARGCECLRLWVSGGGFGVGISHGKAAHGGGARLRVAGRDRERVRSVM